MTPQEYIRVVRTLGQVSLDREHLDLAAARLQRSIESARAACGAVGLNPDNAAHYVFDDAALTISDPTAAPPLGPSKLGV